MSSKPDISVVMSVFNGARYLPASIESVLNQSGVELEFVIVNDGSSDETEEILLRYANMDSRIRVLHQENQGLTHALIRACQEVKSDYIARQDVGDLSNSCRLLKQKQALDADQSLAFVSSWTDFCGPEMEFLYRVKGQGVANTPTTVLCDKGLAKLSDSPSCHPSVMFRTACYRNVGGYRQEFYFCQDHDLWFRLAEVGKFQMLQEVLYVARVTPGSISGAYRKQQRRLGKLARQAFSQRLQGLSEEVILNVAPNIQPTNTAQQSRRREAEWLYFIGENLRKNGDRRAINYLSNSIEIYPYSIRTLFRTFQARLAFNRSG